MRLGLPDLTRLLVLVIAATAVAGTASLSAAGFARVTANPANVLSAMTVQAPASLAASSRAGGAVDLVWPASSTAAGAGHSLSYVILRGPVGGPYARIASTSALGYSDTPLSDGTYGYAVQTEVSGGGAFQSGSATVTALSDGTPPTAPTNLRSAPGTKGGSATVNLTWTAATDALSGLQGYEVRWSDVVAGPTCPAAGTTGYPNAGTVGAVTAATIPLSGTLTAGKKYCAYLVGVDNVGNRGAASATTGPTTAQ